MKHGIRIAQDTEVVLENSRKCKRVLPQPQKIVEGLYQRYMFERSGLYATPKPPARIPVAVLMKPPISA